MKHRTPGIVLMLLTALLPDASPADAAGLIYRHGISLIHEQKYPPDFTRFEYLNPEAPKGGTLVLSTALDINNFSDEWDARVPVAPGFEKTYDHLLVRAFDELSGYYCSLADGVAVSEDRLSITFRLHPDARWHDGTPITAHDVKFTWDYVKTTVAGTLYAGFMGPIEILSEREVVFRLNEKLTTANLALLSYARVLPKHYWKGKVPNETTLVPPLGSAAYRVVDFQEGRFVRYERVRDYWGKDLPVNKGRWNFDEIRYDVYRDGTVAREALRKGLFDAFGEGDIRHWVSSYNTPARDKGWLMQSRSANGIFLGPTSVIAFNARRAPFSDIRVREALFLAMDYPWLNRVLNHGRYEQPPSYFSNSVFASSGLPSQDELELLEPHREDIPARVFTDVYTLPGSDGLGPNRVDLLRARKLLAEAGWQVRNGVLVNSEGQPFELQFLSQYPEEKRILLPYIEALEKLGIEASIRLIESAQLIYRRRSFNFDAMIHPLQMVIPPDLNMAFAFHSNAASSPMTRNVAGIASPPVDYLIETAESADTLETMVASTRALDRVLLWNFYTIPLAAYSPVRLVHWDKFGRPDLGMDDLMQSLFPDGWWYDERKAARIPEQQ